MKRTLQNSMRSRCGFACQVVGLFVFLAGTAVAQSKQPTSADEQPPIEVRSTFPLRSGISNPTPEAAEAMVAAGRQIHFSVELVVADVETLSFWMRAHIDQIVDVYPEVEDRETPGYIHPDARQSLFTTLRSDAGTSILTTPALVTNWGRTISYKTISHDNEDSFFSLSLQPKEVGKGKIGIAVTTRLHPDRDDTQIIGPDELNWDIQSPMDHTLMFPMADVEPAKKMILLIKPSFAGTVSPHTDSPFFASRISGLSNAARRSLFLSSTELAQVDAQKPEVAPAVSERSSKKKPLPFPIDQVPDVQAKLEVMHQRTQSLMTHAPLARIAIHHPEIVDVRQEAPNRISLRGLKPGTTIVTLWVDESRNPVIYRVEVLPNPSVVQVSGVQAVAPLAPPRSEVQQVLDEVREMRKLIQGLRDDMSQLRDSVKQPEQKTSHGNVWIQQGDSQVFARGRKIIQVSGHDPAVVEVQSLAADRLHLTGKKPGRTTLKCLFVGDAVPTSFTVEVFGVERRLAAQPSRLVPHAAGQLPAESFFQTNPTREPVAVQRGPQTDIRLRLNHVYPVKRDKSVARIVLGSSSIVRVEQHSSNEFVIIGVEPGHTSLLVWSDGEADPELFQIMVLPTEPVVSDDNALSLTDSVQGDSARRLIEEALKKETSIDIDDGTLLDAIRQLHETAGVNIAVDTRALEEEGVSTNARVSIRVAGVSLRSVLKLLLTEHNLAILIEDEVLKVTSKQRAEGRQTVVAYRVAEFVDQGSDGQAGFDELITLITTVVEPDSWQEAGGKGSVAVNLPTGALVIRQSQDVHEQIQQLLSALRNWTKTASGAADLPNPIAVGVDELDGGRFSGFAPIEKTQPSLGVQTPSVGPISTGDDSLPEPARPPRKTGAPIALPRKR